MCLLFLYFMFGFIKTKRFVWRDKLTLDQRLKLPLASVYIQSDWQDGKQAAGRGSAGRRAPSQKQSGADLKMTYATYWNWNSVASVKSWDFMFLQTNDMFDFVCFHQVGVGLTPDGCRHWSRRYSTSAGMKPLDIFNETSRVCGDRIKYLKLKHDLFWTLTK